MSIAELVRNMAAAGATTDAIVAAVDAWEKAKTEKKVRRPSRWKLEISAKEWMILRGEVFRRDAHICRYCGISGDRVKLHCDHVVPVSKGGLSTLENLVTACAHCNVSKKDLDAWEWLQK